MIEITRITPSTIIYCRATRQHGRLIRAIFHGWIGLLDGGGDGRLSVYKRKGFRAHQKKTRKHTNTRVLYVAFGPKLKGATEEGKRVRRDESCCRLGAGAHAFHFTACP
jgi:hypothetical protein